MELTVADPELDVDPDGTRWHKRMPPGRAWVRSYIKAYRRPEGFRVMRRVFVPDREHDDAEDGEVPGTWITKGGTKPAPWVRKAKRRAANKRARASRKANR